MTKTIVMLFMCLFMLIANEIRFAKKEEDDGEDIFTNSPLE